MAETTRRRRRRRRKTEEDVVETETAVETEAAVEEEEEEEEEVAPKPKRRRTRKTVKKTEAAVAKEEEEAAAEAEEEEEEVDDLVSRNLAEVLDAMAVGMTYVITNQGGGKFTITKSDGAAILPGDSNKLSGVAYWDEVLSQDYKDWQEEWQELTHADKRKMLDKDNIEYDEHDHPTIEAMRMAQAYRDYHDINKYKPQYKTRAARAAIKA